jgi:hypothetical protein
MQSDDKKLKAQLYHSAYEAAHDILIHEWDPIGVGDEPMAQDEYDAYIPGALRMIADGKSDLEIAEYLEKIETEAMGLSWAEGVRERNLRVAQKLREAVQPFFAK